VLVLELSLDQLAQHVEGEDLAILLQQRVAVHERRVVIGIVVRLAHEMRLHARDEIGDLRPLVFSLGEQEPEEPSAHELFHRPVVGPHAVGASLDGRDRAGGAFARWRPERDGLERTDVKPEPRVIRARLVRQLRVRTVEPQQVLALDVEDDRLRVRASEPEHVGVEQRV
jgi:hypothetical protein